MNKNIRKRDHRDRNLIDFLFFLLKRLKPEDVFKLTNKSTRFFNKEIPYLSIKKIQYGLYEYTGNETIGQIALFNILSIPTLLPEKFKNVFWSYRTVSNVKQNNIITKKSINEDLIYDVSLPNIVNNTSNMLQKCFLAILNKETIKVDYISRNGLKERILSPTKIINTGDRLHIRCYNHYKERYNDYVINRIVNLENNTGINYIKKIDQEWEQKVNIYFEFNKDLSDVEKQLLRHEWNEHLIDNNILKVKTNMALSQYVIRNILSQKNAHESSMWIKKNIENI